MVQTEGADVSRGTLFRETSYVAKSERVHRFCYGVLKAVTGLLAHSYFQVTWHGWERVPRQGPVLLASNHCSFLDPPLAAYPIPRAICFLARDTLFRPPLKWILENVFVYPIRRNEGDLSALKLTQRLLAENRAVLVFPEGTRSRDGKLQPFKPGIGLLALRCNVPVVPVYIQGSFTRWPRQRKFPRPGRIRVFYGEPLLPENFADYPRDREGFQRLTGELEGRVKNMEKEKGL